MNELDFRRHLKDLAHGHHHPDEHDWERPAAHGSPRGKPADRKRRSAPKTPRRK